MTRVWIVVPVKYANESLQSGVLLTRALFNKINATAIIVEIIEILNIKGSSDANHFIY